MTQTKFTSGPWVKDKRNENLVSPTGETVDIWGCGLTNAYKSISTVANAHLIAAAPDMYKALDAMARGEGLEPGTTIESILLKARGES